MVKRLYIDTKKASKVISKVTWNDGKSYRAFDEKLPGRKCFISLDALIMSGVKLSAENIIFLGVENDVSNIVGSDEAGLQ